MVKLIRKISFYKLLPVTWTLLTITLLCLPGSVLPDEGTFTIPQFDKVVHITLFGGVALFWAFHFLQKEAFAGSRRRVVFLAVIFSISLGIALEFVQLYFIPNRDFDVYDIAADTAGALLAMVFILVSRNRPKEP